MSTERDSADVIGRIERLERRNRGLGGVTVASLVTALTAAGASFHATSQPQSLDEVEARRFTLRDPEGTVRATLMIGEDGGATLYFPDRDGVPRATLGVSANGTPALAMTDTDGTLRAALSVSPDGAASVGFFDGRSLRARLGVEADGPPSLRLLDDKRGVRAAISADEKRSQLQIADGSGQTRVGLGLYHDSPGIVVSDRNGATIVRIP